MGSLFNPQVYNSTTYVDQLAVQLGLYQDRLTGETAGAHWNCARPRPFPPAAGLPPSRSTPGKPAGSMPNSSMFLAIRQISCSQGWLRPVSLFSMRHLYCATARIQG